MSRLCSLRFCFVAKNTRVSETLSSRLYSTCGRARDMCRSCRRGYAEYSSRLVPCIYPLNELLDRMICNWPATLPAAAREKYERKYGNRVNGRHYKRLGMLLGSLGLIVTFCDTRQFTGMYIKHHEVYRLDCNHR